MDSYDDGYNAIYEDGDYDWDRYWSDDDYAAGVDDAMEDEDWEIAISGKQLKLQYVTYGMEK